MSEILLAATHEAALRKFKILGISGSLRRQSTNTMALRNAQKLAPEGMSIELADISDIPLYNADLHSLGEPPAVTKLKDQIREADAVLIATPEYNFRFLPF